MPSNLSKEYTVNFHQKVNIVNALNEQRKEEKFCDVILSAEGKRFPTHRLQNLPFPLRLNTKRRDVTLTEMVFINQSSFAPMHSCHIRAFYYP